MVKGQLPIGRLSLYFTLGTHVSVFEVPQLRQPRAWKILGECGYSKVLIIVYKAGQTLFAKRLYIATKEPISPRLSAWMHGRYVQRVAASTNTNKVHAGVDESIY